MKRKLLKAILTVAMIGLMMPAMAFAQEPGEEDYFSVTKNNGEPAYYETAVDAVSSIQNGETATVTLLKDYNGGGVKVEGTEKNITFDLSGNTWTIGTPLVGSTGTETNAFQLLKDNTVAFQNGTITSTVASILFQNYCSLTLDNIDASLLTPGTNHYAASNNNGKTVITGGTTITVNEGNFAMDSFTFGNYDGGDVYLENGTINGDVEIANGGKITVNGGTVNGDVTVYNYAYDDNATEFSYLTVNNGVIEGNISTSELGQTVINNGMVTGEVSVDTADGASARIAAGVFGSIGEGVTVTADTTADITDSGVTMRVVGLDMINAVAALGTEGTQVNVLTAPAGAKIVAPKGVTVKNSTGNGIMVNEGEVQAGGEITVAAPSGEEPEDPTQPSEEETQAPGSGDGNGNSDDKAENTPATGDGWNLFLWIFLAFAAGGSLLFYKKIRA